MCTVVKAPTAYVNSLRPTAHADRVHHMLLYACDGLSPDAEAARTNAQPVLSVSRTSNHVFICSCSRNCMSPNKYCKKQRFIYAWARNAPELHLPAGVAFALGHMGDKGSHLLLQVHYATPFQGAFKHHSSCESPLVCRLGARLRGRHTRSADAQTAAYRLRHSHDIRRSNTGESARLLCEHVVHVQGRSLNHAVCVSHARARFESSD